MGVSVPGARGSFVEACFRLGFVGGWVGSVVSFFRRCCSVVVGRVLLYNI